MNIDQIHQNVVGITRGEFYNIIHQLFSVDTLSEQEHLLNEGLTYHELRQFITLIFTNTRDSDTKGTLKELLRILAKLEIMRVPLPIIKKQKSASPQIFT